MGSCCLINKEKVILIEEFENFRETFIGLPIEDLKTTEKENLISLFNKTLSFTVNIIFEKLIYYKK